jgi:hypothetical protein
VNALVEAMADEELLRLIESAVQLRCSLIAARLSDESFKANLDQVNELMNQAAGLLQPWAGKDRGASKLAQVGGLIDDYRRLVGDPNDPAFRAKLIEDMRRHEEEKRSRVVTPKENDMDRIDRLIRERDERQRQARAKATGGR